jgi:hypothetical protein
VREPADLVEDDKRADLGVKEENASVEPWEKKGYESETAKMAGSAGRTGPWINCCSLSLSLSPPLHSWPGTGAVEAPKRAIKTRNWGFLCAPSKLFFGAFDCICPFSARFLCSAIQTTQSTTVHTCRSDDGRNREKNEGLHFQFNPIQFNRVSQQQSIKSF